eukprot:m.343004 g.343004  ORF g.343004 m.343004 type:complete len:338 (-) comp22206_c0_seq1:160-1173(-)
MAAQEKDNAQAVVRPWWHYAILVGLIAQTTTVVIVMRMSFTKQKKEYLPTVAVVMMEIGKMVASVLLLLSEHNGNVDRTVKLIHEEMVVNYKGTLLTAVPALIYTFQTNLLYIASNNLEGAVMQATAQLKILTTALFSVFILGRRLSYVQWGSLLVLMTGVAVIHSKKEDFQKLSSNSTLREDQKHVDNIMTGLMCVILAAITSGFAGVYIEKILKNQGQNEVSLWMRNIQLSTFSLLFATMGAYVKDGDKIEEKGILQGFTAMVWFLVFINGVGGLCVAAVTKYLDSIIKNFAGALSITFTGFISISILHDSEFTMHFVIGCFMVITATVLYASKL